MSKRTPGLEGRDRDYWPTIDPRAVRALVPHVAEGLQFVEPCAGGGHLIDMLEAAGLKCAFASDLEPQRDGIHAMDYREIRTTRGLSVITNPPWSRPILHEIIAHFGPIAPTWLLFDADWMHTQQASRFEALLTDIVSVGRLRWLEEGHPGDKGNDPFDNCAWYRFGSDKFGATRFWPRQ